MSRQLYIDGEIQQFFQINYYVQLIQWFLLLLNWEATAEAKDKKLNQRHHAGSQKKAQVTTQYTFGSNGF